MIRREVGHVNRCGKRKRQSANSCNEKVENFNCWHPMPITAWNCHVF